MKKLFHFYNIAADGRMAATQTWHITDEERATRFAIYANQIKATYPGHAAGWIETKPRTTEPRRTVTG